MKPITAHGTYSLELAKQLLSVASQFEVIIKLFLAERSPDHSASRMEDLREVLLQVSPHAPEIEITFLPTNETLAPFSPWSSRSALSWWRAYNNLKHDPSDGIRSATLVNLRDAVAALGILTFAYSATSNDLQPPRLFDLNDSAVLL